MLKRKSFVAECFQTMPNKNIYYHSIRNDNNRHVLWKQLLSNFKHRLFYRDGFVRIQTVSVKNSRRGNILVKFGFYTREICRERCLATKFEPFRATFPKERRKAKFHRIFFTANPTHDCTNKIPAEVLLTLF